MVNDTDASEVFLVMVLVAAVLVVLVGGDRNERFFIDSQCEDCFGSSGNEGTRRGSEGTDVVEESRRSNDVFEDADDRCWDDEFRVESGELKSEEKSVRFLTRERVLMREDEF